jgi:phosphoglycerate dehydrogenase-like enzyme
MLHIAAVTRMDVSYLLQNVPSDLEKQMKLTWHPTAAEAGEALADAEAVLTSGRLEPELLTLAPRLRWVQTLSAGVDKLPIDTLGERGITVTSMRGIHAIQMSELALCFMLQWVRQSRVFYKQQQAKVWNSHVPTGELYGKTLGILGAGAIGEAAARKAKAFDMRTIGYNQTGRSLPHYDEIVSGEEGLYRLLERSDFVLVLLPSTPQTRHFLRAEHFRRMKREAVLINLARGSIIREADLIEALRQRTIAGAALDVFEEEPLPAESPLWEMDNVLITPHIAGSSPHYVERAAEIFYENVRRYVQGLPLINTVDRVKGY